MDFEAGKNDGGQNSHADQDVISHEKSIRILDRKRRQKLERVCEAAQRAPQIINLSPDLVFMCWPANKVLVGIRACKWLRLVLVGAPVVKLKVKDCIQDLNLARRWVSTFTGGVEIWAGEKISNSSRKLITSLGYIQMTSPGLVENREHDARYEMGQSVVDLLTLSTAVSGGEASSAAGEHDAVDPCFLRKVTRISLYNVLSPKSFKQLMRADLASVESLDLEGLVVPNIECLCLALQQMAKCKSLGITRSKLGEQCIESLFVVLAKVPTIRDLDISMNSIR